MSAANLESLKKGRSPISGLMIYQAGMRGHFKKAPFAFNADCKWLDCRQMRRLRRALAKVGAESHA